MGLLGLVLFTLAPSAPKPLQTVRTLTFILMPLVFITDSTNRIYHDW